MFHERGSEVVTYLDGSMGVPSEKDEGVLYVVGLEEESCDCPSFRYAGETCKHVFAALLYRAKHRGRFPLRPSAPARPGRRCTRSAA